MGRTHPQTPLGVSVRTHAKPLEEPPASAPARFLGASGDAAAAAVVDRDGRITEVNGPMVALASDDGGTLIGAPWKDRFGEAALAETVVSRAFAGDAVADVELTVPRRGGRDTVVRCTASALGDGSPAHDRVLVVARDITEDSGAGAPDDQLALLVMSSHDAVVGKTVGGVITSWNPGAEYLYGYTDAEVIGHSFEVVVPEAGRAVEAEMLRRIVAGERVELYEAERLRKDGTLITVSVAVSPIMDTQGVIVGLASMSRDLSERKLAEAKVRWMLEVAPDAILGLDPSGSIELVNAQCERLFGYGRAELLGQAVEILIPDGVRAVEAGEIGAGLERAAVHKDGTKIPVEISLSALETSGGRLTMAAVRDITDRRAVELRLYNQNVELERASRAKDNFLASMSHELRTPLNAIIGFTGTMLMKLPGPLNAEQEHQLRLVQTSGKHLLSIINDLLDLAKIESGQVQIALEPVNCNLVVDSVIQSLQPLADGKGVRLHIDAPGAPLLATADRRALGQILINLVNNAIKFSGTGEVCVRLSGENGTVAIAVSDTGPGIPEADLDRIFRAFERSATSAKATDEGTGLGLHISHKLAGLLHATITVFSIVGEGSTFTITLAEG